MVRRHPLAAYVVLACALTWWVYPLLSVSPLLGIPGLFGPAAAAVVVTAVTGGRARVRELLGGVVRWRVRPRWYVYALGVPGALALAAAGLTWLPTSPQPARLGRLSVLDLVVFVLVVGEELGWRGYALPRLLQRRSPLTASVVLGVVWGLWHLPAFLVAGTPQHGLPFPAFVLLTIEYSVLLTWLCLHAGGSVLIATLCHGSINLFQGLCLGGVDGGTRLWLLAGTYGLGALVLAVTLRTRRSADAGTLHGVPTSTGRL